MFYGCLLINCILLSSVLDVAFCTSWSLLPTSLIASRSVVTMILSDQSLHLFWLMGSCHQQHICNVFSSQVGGQWCGGVKVVGWQRKMEHGKEQDGGCFIVSCCVPLLSSVGVNFARFKQGVLLKAESQSTLRSQRPYTIFYCSSRVTEFIIFLGPSGFCVFITLSCAQLMVSEAAKFSVNASLPLVRPVGIDFEEDERGYKARGNERPKVYTVVLLTDRPFAKCLSAFLTLSLC